MEITIFFQNLLSNFYISRIIILEIAIEHVILARSELPMETDFASTSFVLIKDVVKKKKLEC